VKTKLLYVLFLFTIFGCKKDEPTNTGPQELPFRLDYQSGFKGKYVIDRIDGDEHSSGLMASDGLTSQLQTSLLVGTHTLSVSVVTDSITADTVFTLKNDGIWIGAKYDRSQKKVSFIFSNTAFVY
jgi:hypothetical protein